MTVCNFAGNNQEPTNLRQDATEAKKKKGEKKGGNFDFFRLARKCKLVFLKTHYRLL